MTIKNKNNGLIAFLAALGAAFGSPMLAVNFMADGRYSGAVVYTTGLKMLGFGDMGLGIGMCGLIGLGSAVVVGLLSYLLLLKVRGRY